MTSARRNNRNTQTLQDRGILRRALAAERERSKQTQEELAFYKEKALYDTLTGAISRFAFAEALHEQIAQVDRNPRLKLGLFYLDLDDFKMVNDTGGHAAGDHMLQTLVADIKNILREDSHIGRVGGDEFVIAVLAENIRPVRERLRDLQQKYREANQTAPHTAPAFSMGMASFDHHLLKALMGGRTLKQMPPGSLEEYMILTADTALLNAKDEKNRALGRPVKEGAKREQVERDLNALILKLSPANDGQWPDSHDQAM